jgi:hypothetical protein
MDKVSSKEIEGQMQETTTDNRPGRERTAAGRKGPGGGASSGSDERDEERANTNHPAAGAQRGTGRERTAAGSKRPGGGASSGSDEREEERTSTNHPAAGAQRGTGRPETRGRCTGRATQQGPPDHGARERRLGVQNRTKLEAQGRATGQRTWGSNPNVRKSKRITENVAIKKEKGKKEEEKTKTNKVFPNTTQKHGNYNTEINNNRKIHHKSSKKRRSPQNTYMQHTNKNRPHYTQYKKIPLETLNQKTAHAYKITLKRNSIKCLLPNKITKEEIATLNKLRIQKQKTILKKVKKKKKENHKIKPQKTIITTLYKPHRKSPKYTFHNNTSLLKCGDIESNPGPKFTLLLNHPQLHQEKHKTYFYKNTTQIKMEYEHIFNLFKPYLNNTQIDNTNQHLVQFCTNNHQCPKNHLFYAILITLGPTPIQCNQLIGENSTQWTMDLISRLTVCPNPPPTEFHVLQKFYS